MQIKYESGSTIDQDILISGIDKAASALASRMRFGYHSDEDMYQQASLFVLQAMPRWDGKRCVAAFAYTHARNRLLNYKRDTYSRPLPCKCAPGESCNKCVNVRARNKTKHRLHHLQPLDLDLASAEPTPEENLIYNDLFYAISGALPLDLVESYIRLVGGDEIEENELIHIREITLTVMGENE